MFTHEVFLHENVLHGYVFASRIEETGSQSFSYVCLASHGVPAFRLGAFFAL